MPATDQGVSLDHYMLVPRTLTFLTHGDRVLLLKGAETKRLWAGLYNGIGGHVEQGEDVFSAAKRELLEETGLTITDLWLCGIVTVDTQTNPGVAIFIFRGECPQDVVVVSTEGILEWVQVSKMSNLPLVQDLPSLLPRILEHTPGKQPFFAHSWYDESGKFYLKFG